MQETHMVDYCRQKVPANRLAATLAILHIEDLKPPSKSTEDIKAPSKPTEYLKHPPKTPNDNLDDKPSAKPSGEHTPSVAEQRSTNANRRTPNDKDESQLKLTKANRDRRTQIVTAPVGAVAALGPIGSAGGSWGLI